MTLERTSLLRGGDVTSLFTPVNLIVQLIAIRVTWVGIWELFLFNGCVTLRHGSTSLRAKFFICNVVLMLFHWVVVWNVTLHVTCLAESLHRRDTSILYLLDIKVVTVIRPTEVSTYCFCYSRGESLGSEIQGPPLLLPSLSWQVTSPPSVSFPHLESGNGKD